MSGNEKYNGYAADIQGLYFMRKNNPPCGVCHNEGSRPCADVYCPDTRWSRQSREPMDKIRSRPIDGGWEYAAQHLHRCDCSVSKKLWSIYDMQKKHELSRDSSREY